MTDWSQWNALVDSQNIFETTKCNNRKPAVTAPTHIVIHITGTDDFAAAKNTYMTSVSPHYLIKKDGTPVQFVRDKGRAWHAGIESVVAKLYNGDAANWRKYLRYFGWYKGYPADAAYLDADLNPVRTSAEATFVARADGQAWSAYDYFVTRWGNTAAPVNFVNDSDPNNYSIGIEMLTTGSTTASDLHYPPAMYDGLIALVTDLCTKYGIAKDKTHIVGHEDVNPIARFGWDPNQGFDWSKLR